MTEDNMTGTEQPALLTPEDVARILSCSPRTVNRLATSGRIPKPVRLGRLVRWNRQTHRRVDRGGLPTLPQEALRHAASTPLPRRKSFSRNPLLSARPRATLLVDVRDALDNRTQPGEA